MAEDNVIQNNIVITEIMATEPSNLEWIEIQNTSDQMINLEGWKFFENNTNHGLTLFQGSFDLRANEIAIIANKASKLKTKYPLLENTIFDSTWATLNQNGEEIGLKNNNSQFIELFTYIPNTENSLQRIDNSKNDYSANNWINSLSTLGKENLMSELVFNETEILEEIPATEEVDLKEEEIVSERPATENVEIETENTEDVKVRGIKTLKPKAIITIQSGVMEATKKVTINLDGRNSADPNKQKLTYYWDFGDKYTYENKNPPSHSFKEVGNYIITLRVTNEDGIFDETNITIKVLPEDEVGGTAKKEQSEEIKNDPVEKAPADKLEEEVEKQTTYPTLLLNEIFPNPAGRDNGQEWVEIYNPNEFLVNTKGYVLDDYTDQGSAAMKLKEIEILPKSYYLIYDPSVNLNNSNEEIQLLDPNGALLDKIFFIDGFEAQSYARVKNEWLWTTFPTPGFANEIMSEELEITEKTNQESKYKTGDLSSEIYISEILPNPLGEDAPNEWVELYNAGDADINLGNWRLDDNENGSKPFTLSDKTIIKAKGYLIIPRTESKISLDNRLDTVRLFNFEEEIQDEISYEKAKENLSFAKTTMIYEDKIETEWIWTPMITKGAANQKLYKLRGEVEEKNADLILIQAKSLKLKDDNELSEIALSPGNIVELTYDDNNEIKDYSLIKQKTAQTKVVNSPGSFELIKIIITLTIIGIYAFLKRRNTLKKT